MFLDFYAGKEEGSKKPNECGGGGASGTTEETEPQSLDGASDQQALLSDSDRPIIVARER